VSKIYIVFNMFRLPRRMSQRELCALRQNKRGMIYQLSQQTRVAVTLADNYRVCRALG